MAVAEKQIPDSVDWRTKGAVTPISDQGQCGSSPYFGAVVSIEGAWAIAGNKLTPLSVQQIIDCTNDATWGNAGCNGGWMNASIEYVSKVGIETNESYPYTGINGVCHFEEGKVYAKIAGVVNVPVDETLVTAAVAMVPVATAVDATPTSFEFYKSGIFDDPGCARGSPDHGIAIVGYGADEKGTNYYILKNSFATDWGMEGYMFIARNGKNTCSIVSNVSYATM